MDSKQDLIDLYPTTRRGRYELVRYHYVKITLELMMGRIATGSELDGMVRKHMQEQREPDYLVALYQIYLRDPAIIEGWDEAT